MWVAKNSRNGQQWKVAKIAGSEKQQKKWEAGGSEKKQAAEFSEENGQRKAAEFSEKNRQRKAAEFSEKNRQRKAAEFSENKHAAVDNDEPSKGGKKDEKEREFKLDILERTVLFVEYLIAKVVRLEEGKPQCDCQARAAYSVSDPLISTGPLGGTKRKRMVDHDDNDDLSDEGELSVLSDNEDDELNNAPGIHNTSPSIASSDKQGRPVLPANFYINVQQMLHNYICCNIKAQQMLQFVLFNLWRFRSKCWTIYIDYKHSVAAAFIMALIACWISFFREF